MRSIRPAFLAIVLPALAFAGGGALSVRAAPRDYGTITCSQFLAAGQSNIGYLLWWLRGYHAGRHGVPMFDPQDAYAARLGYYCHTHPRARLIDASEHILQELDRGH